MDSEHRPYRLIIETSNMKPWDITNLKIKRYPHFDKEISLQNIEALVNCSKKVAQHKFHPFMYFEERFKPFRPLQKETKIRPIRYACRADSYIYSRYRHYLATEYEAQLLKARLNDCILAYRNIPLKIGSTQGKSNIDFAKELFDQIEELGDCVVVTADISSYFDTIDHSRLKKIWERLLDVPRLPDDHYAVYKSLTSYRDVDYKVICKKLGFFGVKDLETGREGYLRARKEMPIQICSNKKFREIIEQSKSSGRNIVRKNPNVFGIPQGAPLSDVLANAYLFDFDKKVKSNVDLLGGFYRRYSDDIIVVVPTNDETVASKIESFLIQEIKKTGPEIKIQPKKCASLVYYTTSCGQSFKSISQKPNSQKFKMANGLEYLGFRYDGHSVYLRDKTLSNFYRKIKRNAWAEAYKSVTRYPTKSAQELIDEYNYESFFKRFGKVESFGNIKNVQDKSLFKTWTFHTYVKRSLEKFGEKGAPIQRQVRNFKSKAKKDLKLKFRRVHDLRN